MAEEGQFYFQLQEPTRNETLAVGVSSVVVSEKKAETTPRKAFLIRNTSDDATKIITLHIGQGLAVANQGIVLKQYEQYGEFTDLALPCSQGVITAISAVAGGQLSIFER